MKKTILFLLTLIMVSCGARSYVSDNEAIVQSVEANTDNNTSWSYLVKCVYINSEIDLRHVNSYTDSRISVNSFYLYTNTKYTVGDTIRLAK